MVVRLHHRLPTLDDHSRHRVSHRTASSAIREVSQVGFWPCLCETPLFVMNQLIRNAKDLLILSNQARLRIRGARYDPTAGSRRMKRYYPRCWSDCCTCRIAERMSAPLMVAAGLPGNLSG